jgi:hypothetical protein
MAGRAPRAAELMNEQLVDRSKAPHILEGYRCKRIGTNVKGFKGRKYASLFSSLGALHMGL